MSAFSDVELYDLYLGLVVDAPVATEIAIELAARWRRDHQIEENMAGSQVADLDYFIRRAEQEERKATELADPIAARIHLRLAEQYRRRAHELRAA